VTDDGNSHPGNFYQLTIKNEMHIELNTHHACIGLY